MGLADLLGGTAPAQDYVELGGLRSPGRCTIVGAGSPRTWDVRQGYGFSGAVVVFTGDGLSKFAIVIDLWNDSHWSEWAIFSAKNLTKPPKGVRPSALKIAHPVLLALKIDEVVVEDVSQFTQDEDGLWTVEIKLLQHRKPLPMIGKPNAAIPAAAKVQPTAVDAADREILALQAEQAKAAAALAAVKK